MKNPSEHDNFERLMREVLKVPHSEVAARLKAEKTAIKGRWPTPTWRSPPT